MIDVIMIKTVLPGSIIFVIEGAGQLFLNFMLEIGFAGCQILDGSTGQRRITPRGIIPLLDLYRATNGVSFRHIIGILHQRIAAKGIAFTGRINNRQLIVAEIGRILGFPLNSVGITAVVCCVSCAVIAENLTIRSTAAFIHGRVSPVAVEGQHRDRVGRRLQAFAVALRFHKHIGLNISTLLEIGFQPLLTFLGQANGYLDLAAATGNYLNLLANIKGHIAAEGLCALQCVISFRCTLRVRGFLYNIQCKHICIQLIGFFLAGHIVNRKCKGIHTGSVGIITQLCLDLAILPGGGCIGAHHNKAVCAHNALGIHKACALLDQRIIVAVLVHHRNCSGHEQRLI